MIRYVVFGYLHSEAEYHSLMGMIYFHWSRDVPSLSYMGQDLLKQLPVCDVLCQVPQGCRRWSCLPVTSSSHVYGVMVCDGERWTGSWRACAQVKSPSHPALQLCHPISFHLCVFRLTLLLIPHIFLGLEVDSWTVERLRANMHHFLWKVARPTESDFKLNLSSGHSERKVIYIE